MLQALLPATVQTILVQQSLFLRSTNPLWNEILLLILGANLKTVVQPLRLTERQQTGTQTAHDQTDTETRVRRYLSEEESRPARHGWPFRYHFRQGVGAWSTRDVTRVSDSTFRRGYPRHPT